MKDCGEQMCVLWATVVRSVDDGLGRAQVEGLKDSGKSGRGLKGFYVVDSKLEGSPAGSDTNPPVYSCFYSKVLSYEETWYCIQEAGKS